MLTKSNGRTITTRTFEQSQINQLLDEMTNAFGTLIAQKPEGRKLIMPIAGDRI